MAEAIRFHLDEHIDPDIAHALRRVGIDVTTTIEAELRTTPDTRQWAYAQEEARVMVTCDDDFLRINKATQAHAGIVYFAGDTVPMGRVIDGLKRIHGTMSQGDMRGQVKYLRR